MPPTKTLESASILQVCEHRVSTRATQRDLEQHRISREALVECVVRIVSRNLASGRVQRVIRLGQQEDTGTGKQGDGGDLSSAPNSPDIPTQIDEYADRVIACYLQEHHRVERLAAQHNGEWERLFEQLAIRAYHMLLRMQVPAARAAVESADFAQETCETIFGHPFPYDVSFDAWATRILKNHILRRYTRSRDLIDREPGTMSLDRPGQSEMENGFSLYDLLSDESSASAFERVEVREWLIQTIAHLRSQAQQQVIIYTFFYELSDEEIAQRLGKTRNAVHILRHRALQRLKQILAQTERKKR